MKKRPTKTASDSSSGILDWVKEASAILGRDASRFSKDLEWLEDRHSMWSQRNWRVGIIGVTSSGKSALLNAMMGEALLPVGVAPSSSRHVLCQQGPTRCVTIYFEDGRREVIKSQLENALAKYGSEKENPKNRYGVYGIEVSSLRSALASDVGLIDTPGLDAHNLERHHEVTMKDVLPTVDMVLYLTTAKGHTDTQNLEAICRVAEVDKPLILVQNKIDAIRPKLGKGGVEVKTVEQILGELRERAVKLLRHTSHPEIRNAAVCQVSATSALLPGMRARSGIDELAATIDQTVERIAPKMWQGRLVQLEKHLANTLELEKRLLEGTSAGDALGTLRKALDAATSAVDKGRSRLRAAFAKAKGDQGRFERDANKCVSAVGSLGKDANWKAQSILADFGRAVDASYDTLSALLDEMNAALRSMASSLNLRTEDYLLRPMERTLVRSRASVATRSEATKDWRPKRGTVNKVKSFFGDVFGKKDWGKEYVTVGYTTVLDATATARALRDEQSSWLAYFAQQVARIEKEAEQLISGIEGELERRQEDLVQKTEIEMAQKERRILVDELENLLARMRKKKKVKVPPRPSAPPPSKRNSTNGEVDAAQLVGRLVSASHALVSSHRDALLEATLRDVTRSHRSARAAAQLLVLWGWESSDLEAFSRLFLNRWAGPALEQLASSPHGRVSTANGELVVVDETKASERTLATLSSKLERTPHVTFLLLDADQTGSTANTLHRSRVSASLRPGDPLVCVAQSLEELVTSDSVAEGLTELRRVVLDAKLSPKGALANHPSPIYSHVIRQLFLAFDELAAPKAVEDLQRELAGVPGAKSADFSVWLRKWSNESAQQRN